ncbi:MAG: hypothetical protein HRT74_09885 [Flavobacteriales bacterium]|nr:hypothetical protein [Flavobacteriales bacterium]
MKLLPTFSALCAFAMVLASCGPKFEYDGSCGELKEYKVDSHYCKKYNLSEENFTLKYPSNLSLETPEDLVTPNYVSFFDFDSDSILIQSMNIGYYYGLSESGGDGLFGSLLNVTKESLMSSLVDQWRMQGIPLENVTMQDETIIGEQHFTVRANFTSTEIEVGFVGDYLAQMVMMATASDHGVLLIMIARDDSGIKDFKDFETAGCLGPILNTFD